MRLSTASRPARCGGRQRSPPPDKYLQQNFDGGKSISNWSSSTKAQSSPKGQWNPSALITGKRLGKLSPKDEHIDLGRRRPLLKHRNHRSKQSSQPSPLKPYSMGECSVESIASCICLRLVKIRLTASKRILMILSKESTESASYLLPRGTP